ncbi:MAG: hypothetical protein U0528_20120 [Anaerolineae bacterium]|nr:hypothetical protein [Anaerolineae bacterium]
MNRRIIALLAVLILFGAVPALAHENHDPRYSVEGFSFVIPESLATSINVMHYAGDPVDLEQPGGPEPKHTAIIAYNAEGFGAAVPAPGDAVGSMRVYQVADLTDYNMYRATVEQLTKLIADKADLTLYMQFQDEPIDSMPTLPFLPIYPAGQILRARAHYVETETLKGIVYVTVYRQFAAPFERGEFIYTFQALSNDGSTYIAAQWKAAPNVFPEKIEPVDDQTFYDKYNDYLRQSTQQLNDAAAADFAPTLAVLDEVFASFEVTAE